MGRLCLPIRFSYVYYIVVMRKYLLSLLLLFCLQMTNAQDLSRGNVSAYVENKYGHRWKDIALFFAETDVLDENNALKFEKTIPVEGKTKEQLYVGLNYWFLKTFSNAGSQIEMADKDLGVIMAKGFLHNVAYHSGGVSSYYVSIRPIIRCDIHEGEVKITVTIPNYEVTRVDDGIWSAILDEDYNDHIPYKADEVWSLRYHFPFVKKDGTKKTSSKALAMTHGYVEVLLNSFEKEVGRIASQESSSVIQQESDNTVIRPIAKTVKQQIEVVVHRGANALAPENTIASCDSALKYGATWVEVDVRASKDYQLFNLHDETLDRTTNGTGKLSDMLAMDVRKLDAGSWFNAIYKGARVPYIYEMLDHLQGRANVFFDVKRGTPIALLVKLVREKGFTNKSFFWFADEAMLKEFVQLAPEMKVKVNAGDIQRLKYWQTICRPSYVEIAPQNITDEFRDYCHRHGILVMAACQEDDTSQFQLVVDKKADLVNLDRPEVFVNYNRPLQEESARKQEASFKLYTDKLQIAGNGKTLVTRELQQAIDRIAEKGGGELMLTPGTYLSGSLFLKTGVTLHVQKGAILKGSANPYHYQLVDVGVSGDDQRNDNACMALLMAQNAQRITIINEGVIDGNGLQLALNADSLHHTGEHVDAHYNVRRQRPSELVRPKLLFFTGCSDITLQGGRYQSSANWGLSFDLCKNMHLQGLDILNRAYWNNDGIDVTDCQQVVIEDCRVNAADDAICLKSYHTKAANEYITVRNCQLISSASAVKFGTASWGGFKHIDIGNITIKDTFRSAIAIESVDGAVIEDVNVHDVCATNTGNAIFVRLGQRAGERKGSIDNVTIRNLYCQVPFGRPDEAYDLRGPEVDFFHNPFPSSICGIPDNRIGKVTIENVTIDCPGRATRGMAYMPLWRAKDVPEQIKKYPEFSMFGELPAYGFYLRHADNVTFKNVRLNLADEDFRPAFVKEDVDSCSLENVVPEDIYHVK